VELLPARAETADPAFRGGHGQRHEQKEGDEAHGDVGPFRDVRADLGEVEEAVERDVGEEVECRVAEGRESDDAAEGNDAVEAGDAPQGRDGECDDEEGESPEAGFEGDELDGVRGEVAVERAPGEGEGGKRAQQDSGCLQQCGGAASVCATCGRSGSGAQKKRVRSMPA
jgi:hypothetical protein